jgi:uncharacterized membrane protein YdbT with pleckstrin-like domain
MDNLTGRWDHLGGRTLFIFILERAGIPVLLLLLLIAGTWAGHYIPAAYSGYVGLGFSILLAIFAFATLLFFFIGWLDYQRYKIVLDEDSVKISRGILSERTTGVPFRQIKQASIERGVIDQLLGVSKLILTFVGEDDPDTLSDESKITLPALSKEIAEQIQDVILKRSEVEKVDMGGELHK